MRKTLLLNASYQALNFITDKKAIKLIVKDKVETISTWDNQYLTWSSGSIKHPSIVRLKNHVKRNYFNANFSRPSLIKRDHSTCQYCCNKLFASQITIDHVIPKSQGGPTSFTNCVVCCHSCNNKKGDRTPEQANFTLLKKPAHPSFSVHSHSLDQQEFWNPDWNDYLGNF
jgi:5-methylcytosine-specific restriction endonuclease McrA